MAPSDASIAGAFDADTRAVPSPLRLQLQWCRLELGRGATSRVSVAFASPDGEAPLVYRKEAPTCAGGDLRLAVLATLEGVSFVTDGSFRFELVGVKPIRAFDTNLMVVALLAFREGVPSRVVGTAISEDDALSGVARATLHAVNRVVAPHLTRLDPFR